MKWGQGEAVSGCSEAWLRAGGIPPAEDSAACWLSRRQVITWEGWGAKAGGCVRECLLGETLPARLSRGRGGGPGDAGVFAMAEDSGPSKPVSLAHFPASLVAGWLVWLRFS